MEKDYLILKRASASRPLGEWKDDDFDVLANGVVVGRIMKANAAPVGSPWMWTLAFGYQRPHADPRLRADERGRDGGIREELAEEAADSQLHPCKQRDGFAENAEGKRQRPWR
jgi:hypothetical protein